MVEVQSIKRDWNCPVIVAASGPSLTKGVAWECRQARWFKDLCRIVAVNDAYRLFPAADILYACDSTWWEIHKGAESFRGMEKWSSQGDTKEQNDEKWDVAEKFGINLVRGFDREGFSTSQNCIHYGHNSGFQAVNLAILKGATKVILVGFDMREVDGQAHFFGSHPVGLRNNTQFKNFIRAFEQARPTVPILNATPGSALKCFPMVNLGDALQTAEPARKLYASHQGVLCNATSQQESS